MAFFYFYCVSSPTFIGQVGDRVFFGVPDTGSFAEKALVEERNLAPLPDALNFEHGAAIGVAYLTSVQAIKQLCACFVKDLQIELQSYLWIAYL